MTFNDRCENGARRKKTLSRVITVGMRRRKATLG